MRRRGATTTEYGLIAALIAVMIVAALTALSSKMFRTFMILALFVGDGAEMGTYLFNQYSGGDALMNVSEFGNAVQTVCPNPPFCPAMTQSDIQEGFDEADTNTNGSVTETEWSVWWDQGPKNPDG